MDDVVIRTCRLTKTFGAVVALDGLDLEVGRGEIFGFLGPNGAGKSTTIRILLDLLRPSAGSAEVLGRCSNESGPDVRARIGYLPGELRMPGRTSAGAYLSYLTRLRHGRGRDQIASLADRFSLDLERPIGKLSKGNKQKIGVIQAFAHRPELLILDEPTSGLDPLLQHEFQALAHEACRDGATIFMSSHVLSEIEDVAGRVAIIRAGRLVDVDDLRVLRHKAGQEIEFRFDETFDTRALAGLPGVSAVSVESDAEHGGSVFRCVLRGEPDALIKAAAQHRVRGWHAADRELETLFLNFYRTSDDAEDADSERTDDETSSHA